MSGSERVSVLIVGDSPATRVALDAALPDIDRHAAGSDDEVAQALAATDFAAVLIDVSRSGAAGLVTAERVRTSPRAARTPILFLTADEPFPLSAAYRLGAVDHLAAPFAPDVLAGKVAFLAEFARRGSTEAEAELRRKQAELTDFVENATIGLHWVGPDGIILWANRAELELLGYAKDEYVGRHIAEFHADRPVIDDILRRLTGGEELHGYEARLRCKDGSVRHVLISSNVYREGDRFRHTRCFTRDITERKRAEDRQRFLADKATATQPLTDPDEITAATARVLGEHLRADRCAYAEMEADENHFAVTGDYTRGVPSIVGRYALADFGEEALRLNRSDRPFVVDDVEADPRIDAASLPTYRRAHIRAVVGVPLYKGGKFVAGMAVHQATPRRWTADEIELVQLAAARCWESMERARTARALHESAARFRALADTIPQLAWVARADGHIFWYNRRWYEYTGTTPEQMDGWGWQSVHDPAVLPRVLERWTASIATGEPFDMVFPLKGKDGRFRPFLTLVMPRKDAAGRVVEWFGTNTDVAAQKEAEELLRAEARRKDEFIALFAHELRNPLTPISNAVQLLGLRPDAPTVERARQMIDRQVKQLAHIVNDLLEFSRLAHGKITLRRGRVDLGDLARAAAADEAGRFAAAGVDLAVDAPAAPVWVSGDRTRLTQVLSNLLVNAQKFTPRGGRVEVGVAARGADAVLSVRDTGAGMEPELIGRLFRPFTQADQGLARTQGGLGLGLSLVKGLVELHGGAVRAESAGPDRGAVFTVTLVRADEPPAVDGGRRVAAAAPPRARALRVLVIEDNRDSADSLRMLLEICGCEVSVAYTGPDGLAAAKATRPDLVLCDIGLPGLSGYEIARELSAARADRGPMLVALTGYGRDEDKARAAASGFDRHFVKPIDPDALAGLIAGV